MHFTFKPTIMLRSLPIWLATTWVATRPMRLTPVVPLRIMGYHICWTLTYVRAPSISIRLILVMGISLWGGSASVVRSNSRISNGMHVRIPNAFNVTPSTLFVNGYRQRTSSSTSFPSLSHVTPYCLCGAPSCGAKICMRPRSTTLSSFPTCMTTLDDSPTFVTT